MPAQPILLLLFTKGVLAANCPWSRLQPCGLALCPRPSRPSTHSPTNLPRLLLMTDHHGMYLIVASHVSTRLPAGSAPRPHYPLLPHKHPRHPPAQGDQRSKGQRCRRTGARTLCLAGQRSHCSGAWEGSPLNDILWCCLVSRSDFYPQDRKPRTAMQMHKHAHALLCWATLSLFRCVGGVAADILQCSVVGVWPKPFQNPKPSSMLDAQARARYALLGNAVTMQVR